MIPTYRYLTRSIRIAGLPIWQWAQIAVSLLLAWALAELLGTVMPSSWALSTAITIAGLPVAVAIACMQAEFDVAALVRAAIQWRRAPKLLLPGADPNAAYRGYVLTAHDADSTHHTPDLSLTPTDLEALWDRS